LRAVLYCRVSLDDQNIESQIDFARQYCLLHSITLIEIYADNDVSSRYEVEDRPEGARLLADAKAGKFDTVLVFKVDRLVRGDISRTAKFLRECGVTILSMTEPFDSNSPVGEFVLNLLGNVGKFERSNIIERSRSGLQRVARAGEWAGGIPPYGYRVDKKRVVIDPEQSEVVKWIFNSYLSGDLRVRGISTYLNAREVKHSISKRWYDTTVSKLLRNRAYIGELIYGKRTNRRRVSGKWVYDKTTEDQQIAISIQPLISRKDFDRVQRMLTANQNLNFRNVKNFYLLRGLIFCGACGLKYRGITTGKKPNVHTSYRCYSHLKSSPFPHCDGKAVHGGELDAAVWDYCLQFAQHPGQVIEELRAVMQATQDNQIEKRELVATLEKQIAKKQEGRAETIRLHRLKVITEAEAVADLRTLEREIGLLVDERQRVLMALEASEDAEFKLLSVESVLNLVAEKVSSASLDLMREVVLKWVSRIDIETVRGEGKKARAIAHVSFAFRPSPEVVSSIEPAVATSRARLAACWPRTSRKSTL
jgi:site-specific DNA recombinase